MTSKVTPADMALNNLKAALKTLKTADKETLSDPKLKAQVQQLSKQFTTLSDDLNEQHYLLEDVRGCVNSIEEELFNLDKMLNPVKKKPSKKRQKRIRTTRRYG